MENLIVFESFFNREKNLKDQKDLIKKFKDEVKIALDRKMVRPNFGAGTYAEIEQTLQEIIKDLEFIIEDYKTKINP
jgi:hypothetical protein